MSIAMRTSPTSGRLLALILFLAIAGPSTSTPQMLTDDPPGLQKIDKGLRGRALMPERYSRVIVRGVNGASDTEVGDAIRGAGGAPGKKLKLIGGHVADLPDAALIALASNPSVAQVSEDRVIVGAMERTGTTVGATAVRQNLGYDGTGVGVAVIDSGSAASLDDLMGSNGAPRVDRFVDFVAGQATPYDDYGHGSHVAGIIAGNGYDSGGARTGIAPGVRLTVLKVLDGQGNGRISDVIAALDYVASHKDELNIRVVNLSVATGVYESVRNGSAHRGGGDGGEGRGRCCRGGGQQRTRSGRTHATRRDHCARKCPVGADGWRVQPHGNR